MNNYQCIEPKSYALTENKEYIPTKVTEDFIYITNDINVQSKYSISLFNEILPVKTRTQQEILESINFDNNRITFIDRDDKEIRIAVSLAERESYISCGIIEIYNLSTLMANINKNVICRENEERLELKKGILKEAIESYLVEVASDHAIAIMSTNLDEDGEEGFVDIDLCNYLTELSHFHTKDVVNPNSGNTIKMWGFYCVDIDY